jgi:hypothetical protein
MRLLRKTVTSSIAVLVMMLGLIVPSAPASAGTMVSYILRVRHTGMCLEVAGASTSNGALIQQAPCTYAPNQKWIMNLPCGSNCYVHWVNQNSGKCMDLGTRPSKINGSWTMQWDCDFVNGVSQRFQVLPTGANLGGLPLYHIRTTCCLVLYLNIAGFSPAAGANAVVSLYPGDSAWNAQFTLQ